MSAISQPIQSESLEISQPADGKRTAISFALGLATVGILLSSHGGSPLPFIEWTGAFLLAAITFDLRDRRIPNWLTVPSLVIALGLAAFEGGSILFIEALKGAGVMFLLLFPAFALRALGAGDVKALMVLGAFWGPDIAIPALVWMAGAGAFLAIGHVIIRGELVSMLSRWFMSIKLTLFSQKLTYIRPPAESAAANGIPFAFAIGLGAIAFQQTLGLGGPFSW